MRSVIILAILFFAVVGFMGSNMVGFLNNRPKHQEWKFHTEENQRRSNRK